jgi:hypothetical protein
MAGSQLMTSRLPLSSVSAKFNGSRFLVSRIRGVRWVQRLFERVLTAGSFGPGQPFKRKRQRTETIHPRRRFIEKLRQALADVIAFADVDVPAAGCRS